MRCASADGRGPHRPGIFPDRVLFLRQKSSSRTHSMRGRRKRVDFVPLVYLSNGSSRTTLWAAMPCSCPVKPRPSSVVAFTLMALTGTPMARERFCRI